MSEPNKNAAPLKRRSLLQKLLWTALAALVLLLIAYLIVTSSGFLKAVVLPRVEKALNAKIQVDQISLSPFSKVQLRGLKVQTTGPESLLTADEARVRYNLRAILGGRIVVKECRIVSPNIQIVQSAEGSNLDPILKALAQTPGEPATTPPSKGALQVSVQNVALSGATVRWVNTAQAGQREVAELSGVNLTLDQLKNGQPGKLTVAAEIRYERTVTTNAAAVADRMELKLSGAYDFKFDDALLPQTISGQVQFNVAKAQGSWQDLANLSGTLECQLSPTEVRLLGLRFERSGTPLGQIRLSGPVSLAKHEAQLKLEILAIDRQVLNLAGAAQGLDFAQTTLNATNKIDLLQEGKFITAQSMISIQQFSVRQKDKATPPLDVVLTSQLKIDLLQKELTVLQADLSAKQGTNEIVRTGMDRGMKLSWNPQSRTYQAATNYFTVSNLNLSDWQPLLAQELPSGRVQLRGLVASLPDGRQLNAEISGQVQDFSARYGTNQFRYDQVQFQLKGRMENFQHLSLEPYRLEVTKAGKSILTVEGTADYDVEKPDRRLRVTVEGALPELLQEYSLPNVSVRAGILKFSGLYAQEKLSQKLSGSLTFNDFTGQCGPYAFQNYSSALDYDVEFKEDVLRLSRVSLKPRQGFDSGGSCEVNGNFNLKQGNAAFDFNVLELNQDALRPFLSPWLAPRTLISAALNGSGSATYDLKGDASLKANLKLERLQAQEATKKLPPEPLSIQLNLDGSLHQKVVDLRQAMLALAPTARATNQILLQGKLDTSSTNGLTGQFELRSESIDATPIYQLFAGKKDTGTAKPSSPTSPAPAPTPGPTQEPAPILLPIQNLTLEAKIGKFFLGDIAITNWQTTVKIQPSEISINPFQMTLNGAPVKGQSLVNLGIPGYAYELSFQADQVPLDPLATTFGYGDPGQHQGVVNAQAQIKGAGTTGTGLQKNLTGQLGLSLTNLNISVIKPDSRQWIRPVSVLLRVPELLNSPAEYVDARAQIGNGQVQLQRAIFASKAFLAESQGTVTIAPILTNSTLNLPVSLSLQRAVAQRANLLPANTPTNVDFVKLPEFLKIGGTVGSYDPKIDQAAVALILGRNIAGLPISGAGQVGNVVEGVGNVLGGNLSGASNSLMKIIGSKTTPTTPASTNAAPSTVTRTNAPGTNAPAKLSSPTNAPSATTTNPPAKPNPVNNLLRNILR